MPRERRAKRSAASGSTPEPRRGAGIGLDAAMRARDVSRPLPEWAPGAGADPGAAPETAPEPGREAAQPGSVGSSPVDS